MNRVLPLSPARSYQLARPRVSLWTRLHQMMILRRDRRALARMGTDRLRDIGVTRSQAHQEAARRAWDVPQNWRM